MQNLIPATHYRQEAGWNSIYQRKRLNPPLSSSVGTPPSLHWTGKTNLVVEWGDPYFEGNYDMYYHREPIRISTPQLLVYTFRDQNGIIFPLTGYTSVILVSKREGSFYNTAVGDFLDAAQGKVKLDLFTFSDAGTWNIQFVASDGNNRMYWGHPASVTVLKNVNSLTRDEKLVW